MEAMFRRISHIMDEVVRPNDLVNMIECAYEHVRDASLYKYDFEVLSDEPRASETWRKFLDKHFAYDVDALNTHGAVIAKQTYVTRPKPQETKYPQLEQLVQANADGVMCLVVLFMVTSVWESGAPVVLHTNKVSDSELTLSSISIFRGFYHPSRDLKSFRNPVIIKLSDLSETRKNVAVATLLEKSEMPHAFHHWWLKLVFGRGQHVAWMELTPAQYGISSKRYHLYLDECLPDEYIAGDVLASVLSDGKDGVMWSGEDDMAAAIDLLRDAFDGMSASMAAFKEDVKRGKLAKEKPIARRRR
jgi:hypothetical protein